MEAGASAMEPLPGPEAQLDPGRMGADLWALALKPKSFVAYVWVVVFVVVGFYKVLRAPRGTHPKLTFCWPPPVGVIKPMVFLTSFIKSLKHGRFYNVLLYPLPRPSCRTIQTNEILTFS